MTETSKDVAVAESAELAAFWEDFYHAKDHVWSGRVNAVLAAEAAALAPGTVLDLGCGEGGDAIWLAEHGWRVTAVDVSQVALDRAAARAREAGVDARISWQRCDASQDFPMGTFDLVSVQFYHSPVGPERDGALRRAAAAVGSGGLLLIVSHAGFPPWATDPHPDLVLPTAQETYQRLQLDPTQWIVETVASRDREVTGPDGQTAVMQDAVVKLRRARR